MHVQNTNYMKLVSYYLFCTELCSYIHPNGLPQYCMSTCRFMSFGIVILQAIFFSFSFNNYKYLTFCENIFSIKIYIEKTISSSFSETLASGSHWFAVLTHGQVNDFPLQGLNHHIFWYVHESPLVYFSPNSGILRLTISPFAAILKRYDYLIWVI